jgi:hypothetical protein
MKKKKPNKKKKETLKNIPERKWVIYSSQETIDKIDDEIIRELIEKYN